MFGWLRRKIRSLMKGTSQVSATPPLTPKEKARQKYGSMYLGQIIHFYPKIGVGIIRVLKGKLKVGDTIYVQGATTRFKQKVTSIEHNHKKVQEVGPNYEVGIRLGARVREDDDVYVLRS